jgi:hypothetical protein
MSHTSKAGIVERAYGAQNLLNARTEATYARQTVLLEIKCQPDYGVGEKSANGAYPKRRFCMSDGVPRGREVQED